MHGRVERPFYPKHRILLRKQGQSLEQLGVKNLAQGPSSEITLPSLGFDPATFRLQARPIA